MGNKSETRDRLFNQFVQTIENTGWSGLNCANIAADADIDVKDAFLLFRDRYAYVTELVRRIDREMLDGCDASMEDEPARDRLFDVIMARLDAMQAYRPVITALSRAAKYDPMLTLHLMALSRLTSEWMMDMAHISSTGAFGMVRSKGALAAYARAFRIWLSDETEDMAKTMTVLDKTLKKGEKALKRAEKLACALPRLRRSCRSRSEKKNETGEEVGAAKADGGDGAVDDANLSPMPS